MVSSRSPHPGGIHRVRTTLCTGFRNGLDVAVLALWLGHEKLESVNAYIQADPTLKQRALDRLTRLNPAAKPGRYKPSDKLLAFLEHL
jgi:integrase/recombinase XerD